MLKSMLTQDATITRDQLREQIRKSVVDAQAAAEKAATAAAQGGARPGREVIVVGPTPPVGTPGVGTPPFDPDILIPQRAENIAIAFFVMCAVVIIGLPLMRAIARRIDRGASPPAAIPNDLRQQLQQISASVDAIAIEVERISEGQRFTTKMLAEKAREGTVVTPGARQ
jgi:cell division protein FtsB